MNTLMRAICCATLMVFAVSCKPQADEKKDGDKKVSANTVRICTACGELKGALSCCAKDAEKCGECSLNKGSIGCCRIKKDSKDPVTVCTKCGELKGDKKCCSKDAAVCAKCGLNKGSIGCCKLPKKSGCAGCASGAHGHAHEHKTADGVKKTATK